MKSESQGLSYLPREIQGVLTVACRKAILAYGSTGRYQGNKQQVIVESWRDNGQNLPPVTEAIDKYMGGQFGVMCLKYKSRCSSVTTCTIDLCVMKS